MATVEEALTLGRALHTARLAAGYKTQGAAASALTVLTGKLIREKYVSQWEGGKVIPRGDALIALVRLYAPHLDLTKVEGYGPLALILDALAA